MINANLSSRVGYKLLFVALLGWPGWSVAESDSEVPDLSGIWVSHSSVSGRGAHWPKDPPYTPEGLAAQQIAGQPEDPTFRCIIGFGRIMSAGFPTEIIQQDDQIWILYEYNHQIRRIFLDGRGHPEKVRQTFMGHSIGRWEGKTLVVETIGFKPNFFRLQGIPYSKNARITERMTLIDNGKTLESLITVDDPEYYQKSWDAKKYMVLEPDTTILEYNCIVREHLPAPAK